MAGVSNTIGWSVCLIRAPSRNVVPVLQVPSQPVVGASLPSPAPAPAEYAALLTEVLCCEASLLRHFSPSSGGLCIPLLASQKSHLTSLGRCQDMLRHALPAPVSASPAATAQDVSTVAAEPLPRLSVLREKAIAMGALPEQLRQADNASDRRAAFEQLLEILHRNAASKVFAESGSSRNGCKPSSNS